ncbi:hypothetical protein ONE63_006685 [Megalurothrips usitatus]|uniref:Uncharacterized protein n=1 Tax=Megalurothrips usitatus TaxID=439358 RepID=A0AAV7XU59_9NEOP|nr:hypothetical protein ONE63_006685 [Megalurothrips usitatus]
MTKTTEPVREGYLRVRELKEYLVSNSYPFKVFLQEDGTNIVSKFQYDVKSDIIVGPVLPLMANGMPQVDAFPASSAAMIAHHFASVEPAGTAYIMMAQPMSQTAAPFCLLVYGTNNKFTSESVSFRWDFVKKELLKEGIEVIGFSSDGAGQLLRAMQCRLFSSASKEASECPYYFCDEQIREVVFQDTIHLANKLKTRILNESIVLPIGEFLVSSSHLKIMVEIVCKETHGMTKYDLQKKDKMNFNASQKMCSERSCSSLEKVPGSQGTRAYLDAMRNIINSFLDPSLTVLERVYFTWYSTFFMRLWRAWLLSHPKYTLHNNFITSNAYLCLEVNAHSLVKLIRYLRDNLFDHLSIPRHLSSQVCERFFCLLRSMSSTESTVVNFTLLELLQKIKRVDLLYINQKLSAAGYSMPKERRRTVKYGSISTEEMPSDESIFSTSKKALEDAQIVMSTLGVETKNIDLIRHRPFACHLPLEELINENDVEVDHAISAAPTEDDIPLDLLAAFPGAIPVGFNLVGSDSSVTSSKVDSRFVSFKDSAQKIVTMRKSTFCWLLTHEGSTVSSERLERVKTDVLKSVGKKRLSHKKGDQRHDNIAVGDWCAFKTKRILFGQILEFSYLSGKNKIYSLNTAPVQPPEKGARGLGCLATWWREDNGKLIMVKTTHHAFVAVENYLLTITPPRSEDGSFYLSPETLQAVRASI